MIYIQFIIFKQAVRKNQMEAAFFLLEQGLNSGTEDEFGLSCFDYAKRRNNSIMLELLLKYNTPNGCNQDRHTRILKIWFVIFILNRTISWTLLLLIQYMPCLKTILNLQNGQLDLRQFLFMLRNKNDSLLKNKIDTIFFICFLGECNFFLSFSYKNVRNVK